MPHTHARRDESSRNEQHGTTSGGPGDAQSCSPSSDYVRCQTSAPFVVARAWGVSPQFHSAPAWMIVDEITGK
eukprot:12415368-Alexandrium_andersonii.AAC.1